LEHGACADRNVLADNAVWAYLYVLSYLGAGMDDRGWVKHSAHLATRGECLRRR
jgi:hypothetical protein